MKNIIASLLCSFVIAGDAIDLNSTSTLKGKIQYGSPTDITHTFIAAVRAAIRLNSICTVIALNSNTFLSSASRLRNYPPTGQYRHLIHIKRIEWGGPEVFEIERITPHNRFEADPTNYNIAIIKTYTGIENLDNCGLIGPIPEVTDSTFIFGYNYEEFTPTGLSVTVDKFKEKCTPRHRSADEEQWWMYCVIIDGSVSEFYICLHQNDIGSPVLDADQQIVGMVVDIRPSGILIMGFSESTILDFIYSELI